MRRVVATLSDNRSMVAISRTVGKAENSSGRWIHSETIRISTAKAMENARPTSIIIAGNGKNSTVRIVTMPTAKPMSRELLIRFGVPGTATVVAMLPSSLLREARVSLNKLVRRSPGRRRC